METNVTLKEIKYYLVTYKYDTGLSDIGYLPVSYPSIDENGYFHLYADESLTEFLYLPKPHSIRITPIYA